MQKQPSFLMSFGKSRVKDTCIVTVTTGPLYQDVQKHPNQYLYQILLHNLNQWFTIKSCLKAGVHQPVSSMPAKVAHSPTLLPLWLSQNMFPPKTYSILQHLHHLSTMRKCILMIAKSRYSSIAPIKKTQRTYSNMNPACLSGLKKQLNNKVSCP